MLSMEIIQPKNINELRDGGNLLAHRVNEDASRAGHDAKGNAWEARTRSKIEEEREGPATHALNSEGQN